MKDTITNALIDIFEFCPDKPAMHYKSGQDFKPITYREFWATITRFGRGLYALGIRKEDKVMLIAENSPRWAIADLSIIALGAVSVPLFPSLTEAHIAFIIKDAEIKTAVIGNYQLAGKVASAAKSIGRDLKLILLQDTFENAVPYTAVIENGDRAEYSSAEFVEGMKKAKPADIITIVYTSGTTGDPKGVPLTHKNYIANITDTLAALPITPQDVWLSFLPLNHVFARLGDHILPFTIGGTVYYAESLASLRKDMTTVKPTVMMAVPRLFESIYKTAVSNAEKTGGVKRMIFRWAMKTAKAYAQSAGLGKQPSFFTAKMRDIADKLVGRKIRDVFGGRIKLLVSGGAALSDETAQFFYGFGAPILEGYGLTEVTCVVSVNRVDKHRIGTVGIPLDSVEVKIADDGEILVRGPSVMRGYFNNPAASAEVIDQDRWFHTGDIGSLENGFLKITDRKKELLVLSNGKNVPPQPIEILLKSGDLIEDVIVFGDKQNVVTAIIAPNWNMVANGLGYAKLPDDKSSLLNQPNVRALIKTEIDRANKKLAEYERVKKFELIPNPFSVDGGELTPTLKLKRRVIQEKYRHIIQKMANND